MVEVMSLFETFGSSAFVADVEPDEYLSFLTERVTGFGGTVRGVAVLGLVEGA